MAKLKGTGMLAVWSEVPAEYEDEFNEWYNKEHISNHICQQDNLHMLSRIRLMILLLGIEMLSVIVLQAILRGNWVIT